jgi:hypothetical protein
VPDRILLVGGLWWVVEVKAQGKTPTKLQLLEHKKIRKHGGHVTVIDSKEEVDEFLSYLIQATSIPSLSD